MIIGITGSFGSGKTTVAKMFARIGACVIDADKAYHSLIKPGKRCYKKIVMYFGKGILNRFGRIDREKLGHIVFKDRTKLRLLNSITHPEIKKEIKRIVRSKRRRIVIIDAPLLIESGFYKEVDKVILVANKTREQARKLMGRGYAPSMRAMRIIRMQMPFKKKLAFADFIIDNSGSKKDTLIQVRKIWKQREG